MEAGEAFIVFSVGLTAVWATLWVIERIITWVLK